MRKRTLTTALSDAVAVPEEWLPLQQLATVEVTSEAASHPIERALLGSVHEGWRAETAGEQLIRLTFDRPQHVRWVQLSFAEYERTRTQEFVLRWSPDGGKTRHEIVRQQWTFNPETAAREVENYRVDLDGVTVVELQIIPDVSGGDARASLARLRLA